VLLPLPLLLLLLLLLPLLLLLLLHPNRCRRKEECICSVRLAGW
jgi:hypothetical protein